MKVTLWPSWKDFGVPSGCFLVALGEMLVDLGGLGLLWDRFGVDFVVSFWSHSLKTLMGYSTFPTVSAPGVSPWVSGAIPSDRRMPVPGRSGPFPDFVFFFPTLFTFHHQVCGAAHNVIVLPKDAVKLQ